MKLIKQLIFPLFVGSFAFAGSGCSALGFGIGAKSDSSKPGAREYRQDDLHSLPNNSDVQITLKNGLKHEGKFLRLTASSNDSNNIQSIVWVNDANYRQTTTPIDEVEQVVTRPQRNGKWIGLSIGSIVDVIAIFAISKIDFDPFDFEFEF